MQIQIQSACGICHSQLDYNEHHPTILDKCGHLICNKCKLNSIKSEDEESGFINICCPICQIAQENLKIHDSKIIQICESLQEKKVLLLQKKFEDEIQKFKEENQNLKNQILNCRQKEHVKTCSIHEGKKIKSFCKQCKLFCCSTCFFDHYIHNQYQTDFTQKSLDSYCQFTISSLQCIKSSYESAIQKIKQESEEKIAQIRQETQEDVQKVIQNISELDSKISYLNQIVDTSFQIQSSSLRQILLESEAIIKEKIDLIDKHQFNTYSIFNPLTISNKSLESLIIKDQNLINLFYEMFPEDTKLELIYRGSRDSFKALVFHQKCDNQGAHVTLIISSIFNQIFGGYTDISEISVDIGQDKPGDGNSFLFRYTKDNNFQKLKCINKQQEGHHNKNFMQVLGGGRDICIYDDCNSNKKNFCNLGHSYESNGYEFRSNQAKEYLAGSYNFTVQEIEVFKII